MEVVGVCGHTCKWRTELLLEGKGIIYMWRGGGRQNCLTVCLSLQAKVVGTESPHQRGF